jgi:hypothetical protein
MKAVRLILAAALALACRADVKTEEKSLMKFEGMMGRMMGLFGGRAMREGIINTVAVRGNRKMTVNDQTGQIIELDEEKIYELDMKDKRYKVTTFAEMQRRLEEARERMAKAPREPGQPAPAQQQQGQPQMEIDFSVKESGQKKSINGYDCREVVMTIITREKGKTLQESGGMVMTSNLWLGPKIAAMKEIQDFDLRYAQKMAGMIGLGGAEQMAAMLAMYPAMKEMMGKFQAENVNMDGTAILTVMTMESVASAQQAAQVEKQQAERQQAQAEQDRSITSVRGLGGLIGRRMAKRKAESEPAAPAPSQTPGRVTIMTSTHELVRVSTALAPTDLSIPAGFKEKR